MCAPRIVTGHNYERHRSKIRIIVHLVSAHRLRVEGDERLDELREAHQWLHGRRQS